jgi:hypothetical protein
MAPSSTASGERRRVPTLVPRQGRGLAALPRRIVGPSRQHVVDAPPGRPDAGPARDRSRTASRRPGARVGPPAWRRPDFTGTCRIRSTAHEQVGPEAHPTAREPRPGIRPRSAGSQSRSRPTVTGCWSSGRHRGAVVIDGEPPRRPPTFEGLCRSFRPSSDRCRKPLTSASASRDPRPRAIARLISLVSRLRRAA